MELVCTQVKKSEEMTTTCKVSVMLQTKTASSSNPLRATTKEMLQGLHQRPSEALQNKLHPNQITGTWQVYPAGRLCQEFWANTLHTPTNREGPKGAPNDISGLPASPQHLGSPALPADKYAAFASVSTATKGGSSVSVTEAQPPATPPHPLEQATSSDMMDRQTQWLCLHQLHNLSTVQYAVCVIYLCYFIWQHGNAMPSSTAFVLLIKVRQFVTALFYCCWLFHKKYYSKFNLLNIHFVLCKG